MPKKSAIFSALLAAFALAGCASGNYQTRKTFQTSDSLRDLERDKNYIVLIDAFPVVKDISRLVGLEGQYGHVEVIRNERVYGCRPPKASELSIPELAKKFDGHAYEIREVNINGDPEKSIDYFKKNLEGQTYDLYYMNCTDCVNWMYLASGDKKARVAPIDVDKTYESNQALRQYMSLMGMPKPQRDYIFLPDQFKEVGKFVGKGVFGK